MLLERDNCSGLSTSGCKVQLLRYYIKKKRSLGVMDVAELLCMIR